MALPSTSGYTLLAALVKALGLEGKAVRRIVIDAEIRNVAKVYVECFAQKDHAEKIAEALSDSVLDVTSTATNGYEFLIGPDKITVKADAGVPVEVSKAGDSILTFAELRERVLKARQQRGET